MPDDRVNQPGRLKGRSSADTRSAVLDLIRSSGEISRVDLARRSALTETTISKIVKQLLATGVIVQAGFAKSSGGKRPALLRLNDGGVYALGLILDVSRFVIVLCGPDGTELARAEVRGVGGDQPSAALARIAASIGRLLRRQQVGRTSIIGLGVAAGGRRGTPVGWGSDASYADIWEPYPVADELAARTGLTVIRENDADCAALGEYWAGRGPGRDFVTVYMAHGVGCGIVIGGNIYRGASGNAGEIGHTVVDPGGLPCWCGSRGCLETVATPRAIVQKIMASARSRSAFQVDEKASFAEVYHRFGELVLARDKTAAALIELAATHLSTAVLNLVNTLDLDQVVLAGPGFALVGDMFLRAVELRLRQSAFMRGVHPIAVRLASVGPDTAALGAASVMLHRHLTPHRSATHV